MAIRECAHGDAAMLAMLVSEANKDVADKFGLTAENCPNQPSFCGASWIEAGMVRGETYFVLDDDRGEPIACVAYERAGPGRGYLNRLSVLPSQRRSGAGARLVRHVAERARRDGVLSISIGVIGEHLDLQRWYNKLGFIDGETKRFAHLPFSVKYMTLAV